jgi:hypothetical protein
MIFDLNLLRNQLIEQSIKSGFCVIFGFDPEVISQFQIVFSYNLTCQFIRLKRRNHHEDNKNQTQPRKNITVLLTMSSPVRCPSIKLRTTRDSEPNVASLEP